MNGKMIKILAAAGAGLCMMSAASVANAACTKPVGVFVGSATGTQLAVNTGAFRGAIAVSLSLNIKSDGSVSATEKGKTLAGTYSTTWTVSSGNSKFDATTCMGTWVMSKTGVKFSYTSSANGTVITFVDTTGNGVLNLYDMRLQKV